ncbi:MAG: hypothetical protein GWP05_05770 [Anaerolineaceae bacterium]|nr:hypothetical protein [Anaerolineaceae bacterium]
MVRRSQAMTPILSGEDNHGLTFGQTVAPTRQRQLVLENPFRPSGHWLQILVLPL